MTDQVNGDLPMRTIICPTEGCGNQGIPLALPDDGSAVQCGVCGAEIAPQAPDYMYEPPPGVESLEDVVQRILGAQGLTGGTGTLTEQQAQEGERP